MEQPGDTIGHCIVGLRARDAGRGSGTRVAWRGAGAFVLLHVATAAGLLFLIPPPPDAASGGEPVHAVR